MKLSRPEKRPDPETITPLIDVVFFLLVFFMLVGRMDATSPFDVIPPLALSGADLPGGGSTLTIAIDGRYALDGAETTRPEAVEILSARVARDPEHLIRINAHAEAELRFLLPAVADLERTGTPNLVLVVTPEQQ